MVVAFLDHQYLGYKSRYLEKDLKYLDYQKYLSEGFPIATGVIEKACRHLIKDRMDITGTRWTLDTAEAVLKLRALRSSGDFEEYWEFFEQQEKSRNYDSRIKRIIPKKPSLTKVADASTIPKGPSNQD